MSKLKQVKQKQREGHLINEEIRDTLLDVIDQSGELKSGISIGEALELARGSGLDLVKVGEKDGKAVAKIMDFGKFLYSRKKKLAKSKKKQKVIQIKEIKMRPGIGPGDYETKVKAAEKFLKEGKRVKFTLQFRGRQPVSIREVGIEFFNKIKQRLVSMELGPLIEEKEMKSGPFWSKIFYIKE
ncbi:translation initiation factor IF-3 [Candidatus Babeliales bacterium]|nr:translation initiation factor IF-3 [Candidatus Babeliales bacterium]